MWQVVKNINPLRIAAIDNQNVMRPNFPAVAQSSSVTARLVRPKRIIYKSWTFKSWQTCHYVEIKLWNLGQTKHSRPQIVESI